MTDQSTRDQWTRPTRTLERADPDHTEPESSTQDSTALDLPTAEGSAEDGPVHHNAAQGTADDPGVDAHTAEHAVDGSVPADHPDLEQADPEHADPELAVGVASMPDAHEAERHSGGPVDDVNERGDATSGEAPIVATSVDDAAAPEVSGSGDLLPGDVPAEPAALFDGATTERFRDRWQQLQLRFIDDPHTVAAQAGTLADEVITALRDAVDQQRTALEDWQSDDGVDAHFGDTERLRVAVRRYRDFLDRLLAM